MGPSGPLTPPGQDAGPQPQGPGPGGAPISPQEAQPNENPEMDMLIRQIVSAARRIGMKYPAAIAEVREITNVVPRIMQKVAQSRPAPEPMSPPV